MKNNNNVSIFVSILQSLDTLTITTKTVVQNVHIYFLKERWKLQVVKTSQKGIKGATSKAEVTVGKLKHNFTNLFSEPWISALALSKSGNLVDE